MTSRLIDHLLFHGNLPSPGGNGGGGGNWLVSADFVNGAYQVNGTDVAVTDVFQNDDVDGDPFTPSAIQAGVGYVGPGSGDNGLSLAGASLTAALPSATIVLDVTIDGGNGVSINVYDGDTFATYANSNIAVGANAVADNSSSLGFPGDGPSAGVHRLAFSYSTTRLAASFDGGTVVAMDSSQPGVFARVTPFVVGGSSIQALKLKALVSEGDLPALSALS